jgi:tetratricopeptide (TPR) repeat protein
LEARNPLDLDSSIRDDHDGQETTCCDPDTILNRMERVVRRADDFVLGFVKCNHLNQRNEIRAAFLARLTDKRVLEIELDAPIVSLLDAIAARWDADYPPDAVCVYGLEKSINEQREASPVLGRLNNDRDLLRRSIPCPLMIWLPDFALDLVARGAPDFWAWRSGVYEFPTERSLFQSESAVALTSDVPALFSLALSDKHKEIARLDELLRTSRALPRHSKREQQIVSNLLHQLGLLHDSLGDWDKARTQYEQSLQIAQELGDKRGVAAALHELALLQRAQGNLPEATDLNEQSMRIRQELGDKSGIAQTLLGSALLQQDQGNLPRRPIYTSRACRTRRSQATRAASPAPCHNLAVLSTIRATCPRRPICTSRAYRLIRSWEIRAASPSPCTS